MNNILEVKNLCKSFSEFKLDNISIKLPEGYTMGLIGPNSSGKTTVIKLIMNLIKKDSGTIRIFNKDYSNSETEIKQKIGFVYDFPTFFEFLTIKEMTSLIKPFYLSWNDKLYKKYLNAFNLSENKKIMELSKSMKMKYSLIIALSHNARLLILDEPTSGLDPIFRREILEIFSELIEEGNKSILFSTHITSDLDRIADYIACIYKGKILFTTTRDELNEKWGIIKGDKKILNEKTKKYFIGYRIHEFGFEGLTSDINKISSLIEYDTIIEKPTLEDILYFNLKGGRDAKTIKN